MHIGFIHPRMLNSDGVGSTQSASRLVYELANAGHDVTVFCPNREGKPASEVETEPGITVELLNIDDGLDLIPTQRFAPVGKSLLERSEEFEQFDVLHSYVSSISALAEINNRISTPVVTSLNGFGQICPKKDLFYKDAEPCRNNGMVRCTQCILSSTFHPERSSVYDGASVFDEYDGLKRLPATGYLLLQRMQNLQSVLDIRSVANEIDLYHVQAEHLKEIFASFDFPTERFRTVPNMLDEQFLIPHESTFSEPYRLLYVGSLIRKKGVQKLLRVLEYLTTSYSTEYELTIVGDGYLLPYLKQESKQKRLNATITGRIPYAELPQVYVAHDIFVYPGIWEEPFARVFLEALATGTPIVGSPVGDFGEIVGDAGIVTDGSVQGLANGIHEFSDMEELKRRSRAATQRAEQFRPATIIPQFEQLYEEAISTSVRT